LYSIALEFTQVAEVFWTNPVMRKFLMNAGSEEDDDAAPVCDPRRPVGKPA